MSPLAAQLLKSFRELVTLALLVLPELGAGHEHSAGAEQPDGRSANILSPPASGKKKWS